jgi:hypothetical protein
MTQLRGYDMTDSSERFREGATAFRNLRDLAESKRDSAIQKANRVTRHGSASNPSTTFTETRESRSVIYEDESDTSTDELVAEEVTTKRHRPRCRNQNIQYRHTVGTHRNSMLLLGTRLQEVERSIGGRVSLPRN